MQISLAKIQSSMSSSNLSQPFGSDPATVVSLNRMGISLCPLADGLLVWGVSAECRRSNQLLVNPGVASAPKVASAPTKVGHPTPRRTWNPKIPLCRRVPLVLSLGYGSKFNHQDMDRRSNRPCFHFTRACAISGTAIWGPAGGLPFLQHSSSSTGPWCHVHFQGKPPTSELLFRMGLFCLEKSIFSCKCKARE